MPTHAVTGVLGVDIDGTTTGTTTNGASAKRKLGERVLTSDGGEYMYVQANGAITQYDAVGIDEDFQAAALTKAIADDGWTIGFAQVAFSDNDFGWIAVRGAGGNIKCRLRNGCLPDVTLYTSAVAGMLDDTSASQTNIDGVVAVSTAGSSGAAVEVIATFPRSTTF